MQDVRHQRVTWADTAKGIGIILVVLGHTINGLYASGTVTGNPNLQFLDAWIYTFHMPLFFFLSGLFVVASSKTPFSSFTADKLRTVAYPYFVWSVVVILLKSVLGAVPNIPRKISDLALIFYQPVEQFWFLYVLFFLMLIFRLFYLGGRGVWPMLVMAVITFPALTPVSDAIVLNELRYNAIYFVLGALFTVHLSEHRWNNLTLLIVMSLEALVVPAILLYLKDALLTPLEAVVGIAATVSFSILIDRHSKEIILPYLGRHSLEIFVLHSIISASARVTLTFCHISALWVQLSVGFICGLLVPLVISKFLRSIGVNFAFTLNRSPMTFRALSSPQAEY